MGLAVILKLELHGGEPLIVGKHRRRDRLRECRGYPGDLRVACQTNATLLDDEWISLFQEELPALEFAASLDGDRLRASTAWTPAIGRFTRGGDRA